MTTRAFGMPIARKEDRRFLTGTGTYVDDIDLPDMLHAAILRSPFASARILSIDVSQATGLDGVLAVLTHKDLGVAGQPLPLLIPHPALTHPHTQYALAKDVVRYVGEAVAMVVATDRYVAEDALELIDVEYQPLPVVSPANLEEAVAPDAPLVHANTPQNIAAHLVQQVGDIDAAFAHAPHVFQRHVRIDRSAAQPLETRGVVARFDAFEGSLTIWDSTQAPISIRNGLAVLFGLPRDKVRVTNPDIGGGFGVKIMLFYPEEVLVPLAAMRLGRPVKWTEDRREHMTASNHERGQVHDIAVAMDADGRCVTPFYTTRVHIVPMVSLCR
jgi:CO/xanthine dehydrogenase Mo-binding subunit